MREPDLFANFERMRREMDELFGDAFGRARLSRKRSGFSPAVDVAYKSDPPTVIVTAELAGIELEDLELEIQGRSLVLQGNRPAIPVEEDVYQQVEIERGPFRRVIELGVEVRGEDARARYENGMLKVELPVAQAEQRSRVVPIEGPE